MNDGEQTMQEGDVKIYRGKCCTILAVDPDPTCDVWVVFEDDCDADAMVNPNELEDI